MLRPAYEAALNAGAFSDGTDSTIIASEERNSREDEENRELLTNLIAIRAALAKGDKRALYLGWLSAVRNGLVDLDASEPPVPPALGASDGALDSLTGFLNLPEDLLLTASRNSGAEASAATSEGIAMWLVDIHEKEKDQWLTQLLSETNPSIPGKILKRYRDSARPVKTAIHPARTAGTLLAEADERETERRQRQREDAAANEHARIMALAGQESGMWKSAIQLSDSSSSNYQDRAMAGSPHSTPNL